MRDCFELEMLDIPLYQFEARARLGNLYGLGRTHSHTRVATGKKIWNPLIILIAGVRATEGALGEKFLADTMYIVLVEMT